MYMRDIYYCGLSQIIDNQGEAAGNKNQTGETGNTELSNTFAKTKKIAHGSPYGSICKPGLFSTR